MNTLDINPRIIAAIYKAKLDDFKVVITYSVVDLKRLTGLSANDICILQKAIAEKIVDTKIVSTLSIYKDSLTNHQKYLSVGCSVINQFLRGGIICPGLTEIAGESACGKTQLCMQLSLNVQLPFEKGGFESGALYICTEDVFPNKRLIQMAGEMKMCTKSFTDNIFIEHASDLEQLWYCVKQKATLLLKHGRIRLVIIDSIAAIFRSDFTLKESVNRAKQFSSLAAYLHAISNQHKMPIVCVNQVTENISKSNYNSGSSAMKFENTVPALGMAWANLVTCSLMLKNTNYVQRKKTMQEGGRLKVDERNVKSMSVLFAPHLPKSTSYFLIDGKGVTGLSE